MGHTSYSVDTRNERLRSIASNSGSTFYTNSAGMNFMDVENDHRAMKAMFTQEEEQKIHAAMSPKGWLCRECRDSEAHPRTVPTIIGLDVTASMGKVPKDFIMDGLPTMMTTIIDKGTPDASLCFMAVGDHVYDSAPIQVGQFESGDAELDMWLGRTWLEKRGGPNDGESYMLPWYVAAYKTKTDACEKRDTKGFLFTVGDEPCLPNLPMSAVKGIFGNDEPIQADLTSAKILADAQKCWNVFHIALTNRGAKEWKKLLGQNYIPCDDYKKIPGMIADIISGYQEQRTGLTGVLVGSPGTGKTVEHTITGSSDEIKITL